jgi:hypothetical protein
MFAGATATDQLKAGLWVNRRQLASISFKGAYTIVPQPASDGWLIKFTGLTEVTLERADGSSSVLQVPKGSFLFCSGEEMYLSMEGQPAKGPDGGGGKGASTGGRRRRAAG